MVLIFSYRLNFGAGQHNVMNVSIGTVSYNSFLVSVKSSDNVITVGLTIVVTPYIDHTQANSASYPQRDGK